MPVTATKLTPEQIEFFHENGYIGPLTLCSPEEMADFRRRIEAEVLDKAPLDAFGVKLSRDRHLDSPAIWDLITQPVLEDYLSQILGPEMQIWRSSLFVKPPGAPATVWHQTNVFKEFVEEPILDPPDKESLFQVTTWIAIDEASVENGCVQLMPGTHKTFYSTAPGALQQLKEENKLDDTDGDYGAQSQGFFGYDIKFKYELDPSKVVNMECKPGEFFIFTQRTLHGSPPNTSDKRRFGLSFRTVQSDVKVYHKFLPDGKIEHYGETFDLTKWGCVQLGADSRQLNKIATRPTA